MDEPLEGPPFDLDADDEDVRRWAIIDASRSCDRAHEQKLLDMLNTEPSEANRRHIVRALGHIGSVTAAPALLDLLATAEGLILGDVAEALGQLREKRACESLRRLTESEIDWVRNKATWALHQIET